MHLIHWGSYSDRYSQTTATDLTAVDFTFWLQWNQGNAYGIVSVTPMSEADFRTWQAKGLHTLTKAQVKLGN